MAVFDPKSRYVDPPLEPYAVTDRRGRTVMALPMPEPPVTASVGDYLPKQGQRLDHLAAALVQDPFGFWRIAEANGAVLPDALEEVERLRIPPVTR
ncbi:hypothetical protein [Roseospira navarrensis]|uniref:LysM domain-containing protein n=1 Tax=Roseospira navarrensis TaxID=140058 RepID=A0A7X1ZI43_9PROT|nr:hypothetical protein [Roseospira navarrensis]MQX37650.1 hypothetical protein [Roseospira navarrensis]